MLRRSVDLAFLLFILVPSLHFTTKHAVKAVCPGDNITEPIPLYFALMVAESNESTFISAGTIPAIDLAVDRVNDNPNILPGYELSYNGTVFDTRVSRLDYLLIIIMSVDFIMNYIIIYNYSSIYIENTCYAYSLLSPKFQLVDNGYNYIPCIIIIYMYSCLLFLLTRICSSKIPLSD